MRLARVMAIVLTMGMALLTVSSAAAQAQLKSPDKVKTALRLLVQVSNDFKRQINAKNFPRVPRENGEYKEAADALRAAVADEPAAFKSKVEMRLNAAVADYQKISDMSSASPDVDKLMTEHAKAVKAMNALFDLFPADMRPDPNAPPPGRGGAGPGRN